MARAYHRVTNELLDYFRLWILVCCVMQGVAAAILMRVSGSRSIFPALGLTLLLLSLPAFLYREHHASLSSQFTIVLSLAAYLWSVRGNRFDSAWKPFNWILLPVLLIHFYLYAMCAAIYAATLGEGLRRRKLSWRPVAKQLGGHAFASLILLFISGYIAFDNDIRGLGGQYGHFSMNLLSPFVPHHSGLFGDASLALDGTGGQYEGYNYLGIGILLLTVLLTAACWRAVWDGLRRHLILTAVLSIFILFSISNVIYAGPIRLVEIPLIEPFNSLFGPFRSSGRFFWPVAYALASFSIIVAWRWLPRQIAIFVLCIVVLLQVLDSRGLWKDETPVTESRSSEISWDKWVQLHKRVHLSPQFDALDSEQRQMSLYLQWVASAKNIPISSAYLARSFDRRTVSDDIQMLEAGEFDEDTLYVFLGESIPPGRLRSFAGDAHARAFRGGYIASQKLPAMLEQIGDSECSDFQLIVNVPLALGELLMFDESSHTTRRTAGFRSYSKGGRSNEGREAHVFFHFGTGEIPQVPASLLVHGTPDFRSGIPQFYIELSVNGVSVGRQHIARGEGVSGTMEFVIPTEAWTKGNEQLLTFRFLPGAEFEAAASRRLGPPARWRFFSLQIRPAEDPSSADTGVEPVQPYLGEWISLGKTGGSSPSPAYTLHGFSEPEAAGRWTNSATTLLRIRPKFFADASATPLALELFAHPFAHGAQPLTVEAFVGGVRACSFEFGKVGPPRPLLIPIPPSTWKDNEGSIELELKFDHLYSPAELGLSSDQRHLGLFVRRFRVRSHSGPFMEDVSQGAPRTPLLY